MVLVKTCLLKYTEMKYIKGGMHQGAKPQIFEYAKYLRHNRMTSEELKLWNRIKNKQLLNQRFRRQPPIGPYILDFFCPGCKLGIEVDGESHLILTQKEYDIIRTEYLNSVGIIELRFTNEKIEFNLEEVIKNIKIEIQTFLTRSI